jgi:GH18 family chitinase
LENPTVKTCYLRVLIGLASAAMFPILAVGASSWGANSHPTRTTASHGYRVIGYIDQWDAWKTTTAGLPAQGYLNHLNLDYSQYTHLNYCFFGVADDGSLNSGDFRNQNIWETNQVQWPAPMLDGDVYSSWDYWLLYGDLSPQWETNAATTAAGFVAATGTYYDGNDSPVSVVWSNTVTGLVGPWPIPLPETGGAPGVLALAHTNGVKVMASIGGWSMCKHYSAVAANPAMRATFVAGCKKLMTIGFDGIDFDWEYPGPYSGMNFEGSTADYTNFLTLIQEVRAGIGTNREISVCLSATPAKLAGFNWPAMVQVVDSFNLMTYDFQGGWSLWTGHNAPLYDYPNEEGGPGSAADCVQQLIASGVPREKIAMGLPFYGRGVVCSNTAALNAGTVMSSVFAQPDGPITSCADFVNWPQSTWAGVPDYYYLRSNTSGWLRAWDTNAAVPYLTSGDYFLSYDDSHSIGLKAQYVRNQNIGGVIVWNAFGDLIAGPISNSGDKLPFSPTNRAPLINVVNSVLAGDPVPADGTEGPAPAGLVLNRGWWVGTGAFALNFSGPNGSGYHILASTNAALPLSAWNRLTSGTIGAVMLNFTNRQASAGQQFYRISSP